MISRTVFAKNSILWLGLLLSIIAFMANTSFAGTITLVWDPPATNTDGTPLIDLAGYKIHYGTTSGSYTNTIDVGNVTTSAVYNLTDGHIYYFAATAYDSAGIESSFSNEVSKTTAASQFTLTTTKMGTGTGTLTSAPAGITCGGVCGGTFNAGTSVTITASPDANSTFGGWSGACTGTGACTVLLDTTKTVTAVFNTNTVFNTDTIMPEYTTNNNFTLLGPDGTVYAGTNDVTFIWDGTLKTSVAASGQTPNATLSSPCLLWGDAWSTHDVAIYGPGTYTVYAGCAPGSPGCGTGSPYTFTVAANEIGVHLLWDWNVNKNNDVVNVWQPQAVFGPSAMWTGGCGSNPRDKVWDWMSKDWTRDGVNGAQMIDGPLAGLIVNFNVMAVRDAIFSTGNNFTLLGPDGIVYDGTNDVTFTWDGTLKTSVAVYGQTPNATLSSPCLLWGDAWSTHDVAIYGPGTYTVYTGCAPGSPGCRTGSPYTFTVAANEIGVHLLWDWNVNKNNDVVNVWQPQAVFGPSAMWTGGCGSNPGDKVWDWMSKDWTRDGVNGAQIIDGPLAGWIVNFSVMAVPNTGDPYPCDLPWGGTIPSGQSVNAYAEYRIDCGQSCADQTRTCTNGVLSGSYRYSSCSAPTNCLN